MCNCNCGGCPPKDSESYEKAKGPCDSQNGRDGCTNEPAMQHTCPFMEEIHNNFDFTCTCCSNCEQECGMDI